jgi:hypothetical protein
MGEFAMHDLNPSTNEFDMVISSTISTSKSDVTLEYNESERPIYWNQLMSGRLPDSPKCGYNRAKCPVEEPWPLWVWLLIGMGCLMLVMLVIGVVYYRRAQFEAELNAMSWLIKWEEVSMNEKKDPRRSKKKNNVIDYFDPDKEDNASLISVSLSQSNTVYYKRNLCYIKKITKAKIDITRSILLEVKKVSKFAHTRERNPQVD